MIVDSDLRTIERAIAFAERSTLIVAVSGGCDSVALLHILRSLRERLNLTLHVAALDHGIRGDAGQRDVGFVRDLAESWDLPCSTARVDVPALAGDWGVGLETAARRARYDYLARVAQQEGSSIVAVGHHALDQAETILMHIIRGSGGRGLSGMRNVSPMPYYPAITLLRPLLSISRDQLVAYCAAHSLVYRRDETNEDRAYTRNYLRHEILDRLRRLNPDLLAAFGRLAESAAVDEEYFAEVIDSLARRLIRKEGGAWRILRQEFATLHPALQRRLLREAFRQLAGDSAGLSHKLTLDLLAWAAQTRVGAKRDLGASVELYIDYDAIWIRRTGSDLMFASHRFVPRGTDERVTPSTPYMRHGLRVAIADATEKPDGGVAFVLRAGCEVRLRTRRPGDRFKPKGMGGHSRKLKDWMIDRKIPRYLRDCVPLVTVDGAIVAICLGQSWRLAEPDPSLAGDDSSRLLILM